MAKKTVKAEIPIRKLDEFDKLCKKIIDKNQQLGNNSPLKNFPKVSMVQFGSNQSEASGNRLQSENLRAQSENKMLLAHTTYGMAKGQSVDTPGTLYNNVSIIRDFLLSYYDGDEEALSEWGFNIVIGTAKSPTKKPNP